MARATAGLLSDQVDRFWLGTALGTLIFHELSVYNEISGKHRGISYYRTPAGVEIDFIIETAKGQRKSPSRVLAIEVKLVKKWNRAWDKPMRSLAENTGIRVDRMIGVYCGTRGYLFDDIHVMSVGDFMNALFKGVVFLAPKG